MRLAGTTEHELLRLVPELTAKGHFDHLIDFEMLRELPLAEPLSVTILMCVTTIATISPWSPLEGLLFDHIQ